MSAPKCARVLIEAAVRDLQVVRLGLRETQLPEEVFGFHAQQAIEKLVRAWLAILGEVYPLTHDLESLFDLLEHRKCEVESFRALADYTPFAVIHRYEALGPGEPPMERREASRLVESLVRRVKNLLAASETG